MLALCNNKIPLMIAAMALLRGFPVIHGISLPSLIALSECPTLIKNADQKQITSAKFVSERKGR